MRVLAAALLGWIVSLGVAGLVAVLRVLGRGVWTRSSCADPPLALVLLSGGLDSAVALAVTRDAGFRCVCLAVDYGQANGAREFAAARAQAEAAGSTLEAFRLEPGLRQEGGPGVSPHYVPGRNAVLVALALSRAESLGAERVVIGATAEDRAGFPDCRPGYFAAWNVLARRGQARPPSVVAPLARLTKARVILRGAALGVDLARTWSCYGLGPWRPGPCGSCGACEVRARGFREAGVADPLLGEVTPEDDGARGTA